MSDPADSAAPEPRSPGRQLAAMRVARGLTVTEIALRLKFSPKQIEALETDRYEALAGPAFVLLIPIFDTTLVTVARLISGRSPATGGRDHSSHRLVAIGLSERNAVLVRLELERPWEEVAQDCGYPSADAARMAVHRALKLICEEMARRIPRE